MQGEETDMRSDEALVVATRTDSGEYRVLMERYEAKLRRYIGRLGVSVPEDQDDILQDVFVRVYEHLNSFNPALSFSSWIYRIAHNTTMSFFRKRRTGVHGHLIDIPHEAFERIKEEVGGDHLAYSREREDILRNALQSLSPEYREVIVLFYFESQSYEAISDILRIPPGTAATRLRRAREHLKQFLLDKHYHHG